MPDTARIFHHKNDCLVDVPLYDVDGSDLWPDLVPRLDRHPKLGTLIVMRDQPDRKRKLHLPWATSAVNPVRHVQRFVAMQDGGAAARNHIHELPAWWPH
jgi:hypothetical protein